MDQSERMLQHSESKEKSNVLSRAEEKRTGHELHGATHQGIWIALL